MLGMAAQGYPFHLNENQTKKGRPRCEHWWKLGHWKDKRWGLHGKPLDYKPRGQKDHHSRVYLAVTSVKDDSSPFIKEQLDAFRKLPTQTPSSTTIGTGLLLKKVTLKNALAVHKVQKLD